MKKLILILIIILASNFAPNTTEASSLSCYDVDGMSIFGYDYDEWIFIGAIANEYDSDSIANEYGAGSEYDSDSINNEYGDFGSHYSSDSAFNDYASNPPILIDDDYNFVGYLTTNDYKSPSINTYEAIACANNSYTSSNSDMEDVTFQNIPTGSSYGSYSSSDYDTETSCPSHSSPTDDGCRCNSGYMVDSTETRCVPEPEPEPSCPTHSSPDNDGQCSCDSGYIVNDTQNGCVSLSNWCSATYGNTYVADGQCVCLDGYSYDETTQSCKIVVKQPVVVNNPVVKDTPKLVTETKIEEVKVEEKPILETEIIVDTESTSVTQDIQVEPAPEPTVKLKWYQKIFNWFKKNK